MQMIALVDDDEGVLTSVSIALELEGYKVTTYRDGAFALVAFKTSAPDLIILDIKMPRMDGMEMLRRLRETSRVPVILLTCKDDEVDEVLGGPHVGWNGIEPVDPRREVASRQERGGSGDP